MHVKKILFSLSLSALSWAGPANAALPSVGLSTVRARAFDNEDLFFFRPQQDDLFGSAVATGDFNGDGVEDLATGIPYDDGLTGSGCTDCGGVVVRYGISGRGLDTALADDFLSEQYGGSLDLAEAGDLFGAALAAGDFNGDGIDDLAVGIPMDWMFIEEYGYSFQLGAVQIHYGGSGGIQLVGEHFLQPGSYGVPYPFEDWPQGPWYGGPRFGAAVAAGDFDGDGYDDLVIGIPDQITPIVCAVGGDSTALSLGYCAWRTGGALLLGGGIGGLLPFYGGYMFEGLDGLPDTMEGEEEFGRSVAAADFNGDGYDDLAIGVPQEDGVGAVMIVFGSPFSLILADHRYWSEYDLGQPVELEDHFAQSLATGDFDGDGRADLAIGAPFEDVYSALTGDVADAGAVTVLYGAAPGFDLGRKQYFDQGFGNPLDADSEPADLFGAALAAGDFNGDGRDDLAVAHYGEDGLGGYQGGAVTVLTGSPWPGLEIAARRQFEPSVGGVPGGPPENYRFFGYAIATGDFDDDGFSDLAIGAPLEDVGAFSSAGSEMVLYGSLFSDGFESGHAGFWANAVP